MRIAPGIHLLKWPFVNAYLVEDEEGLFLIDAGAPGAHKGILRYLQYLQRRPDEVKAIAITHYHFDHVGGAAAMKVATGAQVYAGAADVPYIEGKMPPWQPPLDSFMRILGRLLSAFFKAQPCVVDRILREGDRVGPLVAVATPGHTPGHTSYYWPQRRVLFVGDALVAQPNLRGPRRDYTMDMATARGSVKHLAELAVEILCLAHGEPILSQGGEALQRVAGSL